jgi:hypothetical protein
MLSIFLVFFLILIESVRVRQVSGKQGAIMFAYFLGAFVALTKKVIDE